MFLAKTCTNPHQFTKSAPVCIVSPSKISAPRLLLKPAPEPNWKIWKYRGLLKAFFEVKWGVTHFGPWVYPSNHGPMGLASRLNIREVYTVQYSQWFVWCLQHPFQWLSGEQEIIGTDGWSPLLAMASLHGQPPAIPTPDPFWNPACCGEFPLPKPSVRSNKARCRWTSSGSQVSSPNEPTSVEFGGSFDPQSCGKWRSAADYTP